MNISFVILVAVLHVYMASAEPLPARSAHAMTVVQRRKGYQGSEHITSEEYQSSETNQEEEEDDWNESKEQNYSEHESKDSNDIKSLEAKHSNETINDNKNDENHHSHEIGHLAENIEKSYNYTKQMEAAVDLSDPREIAEVLYEITGFSDETMVIAYCKTTAGLKTDEEAYDFLMNCSGARGIKFVIRLLKKLADSANIKVIVQLVNIITGEDCVTKGLKIIKRLTGHDDIDGIIEVLQKISGRNSISDLIDFFEHNENHTTGLDGISHQIYKLTGGVGPKEFPGVFEALKSEVDWTATFNILITVMRCNDISESIVDLKKLIGAKTFPEAIDVMKLTTEQTHFRYALEAFLEESGRVNLKIVIETLYKLTGKSDLMSVHRELQRLYKINNIIKVFQTVNKISKKRDPLVVLSNLLDITGAANLSDCSAVFTGLTFRQMTALEVIDQIQEDTGCTDLVEFLRGMLIVTGTRTLLKSWQVIVTVTQKNDIFVLINTLKQYTSVDLITVFRFLQRITNTVNIVPAIDKINELLEIKGFFEWMEVLHHIVEIDVIVFLESFASLSPRSLLEDAIDITMHYTGYYEPIQAIMDLREATQQEDILKAIEYVKSKKSKTDSSTTPTPENTVEPTTEQTPVSTPEATTESIQETTTTPTPVVTVEPTTEQTPVPTTDGTTAVDETSQDILKAIEYVKSKKSKTDSSTTPTPENTVEPTTEQTPLPTTDGTTAVDETSLDILKAIEYVKSKKSKTDSSTTPTPENTVEPTTEQTPVPTTDGTTAVDETSLDILKAIEYVKSKKSKTDSSTTPTPENTVEPTTEQTPLPTTDGTTAVDETSLDILKAIEYVKSKKSKTDSSTTPTPENTVEPTTEQTPVPTPEATTESIQETTTTPTPVVTVEPTTEQTPVPTTDGTTAVDETSQDILKAIEYVKSKKSKTDSSTTPTPENTVEPTTEQTPLPTTDGTTAVDETSLDILKAIEYVKSKKSKTDSSTTPTPENTVEPTTEQTPLPTTDGTTAVDETSLDILKAIEYVKSKKSKTDSSTTPTPENTVEPTTEQTPLPTTDGTTAVDETSLDILKAIEYVKSKKSKTDSSTTPTPENTVEPTTEQTPVPTPEATTESIQETTTTPTPVVTVEPTTEQTPVPTTDGTTAVDETSQDILKAIEYVKSKKSKTDSSTTPTPENTVEPTTEQTPLPTTDGTTAVDDTSQETAGQAVHIITIVENQQEPDSQNLQETQETTVAPSQTDTPAQPTNNDQQDLNNKPNSSNTHDIKVTPEKETPVTSDKQNSTENPNNKDNEKDSQPAVPADEKNTVKEVTIIVHTNTVPSEAPNQEKPLDKPIDSSKDENVIEKPKEENTSNSTTTQAPETTSNPTEVSPSETTEKPIEDTTPSDQPKETSHPDNNPNTEVPTENPITEATTRPSVTAVDQSTPNDIPTTEQSTRDIPDQETTQGTIPGIDNKPCTKGTPSDKESSAIDKPDDISPTTDNPHDNPSSQPSEPKFDGNDNNKPDGPTEVQSTTAANTDSQEVKPDPQALQVNMNLKLLILPKGPKNTKNCYCACDSQDPPKLIPMKHLPIGITNVN